MNKRGISSIIITILLVLLAIAALGILWIVIMAFVNSNTSQLSASLNLINLQIQPGSVSYSPTALNLSIKRDAASGNLSGINIILTDEGGKSYTYKYQGNINELEAKQISVPVSSFVNSIGNIAKIDIYPVAIANNGKDVIGKLSDSYQIGEDGKSFLTNDDLIFYAPFDNDFQDKSGSNIAFTCIGNQCPTLTSGKISGAYQFVSGENDYLAAGDKLNMGINNFSISFWIKDYPMTLNTMVIAKGNAWNQVGYDIHGNTNTFLLMADDDITANSPSVGGIIGSLNTWHNVAFVVDRANKIMTSYYDGVQNSSTDISSTITGSLDNTNSFMIGCVDWDSNNVCNSGYSTMVLDEVHIYNRSLSSQEVYYLYKYG